jgi:hypothetical protein
MNLLPDPPPESNASQNGAVSTEAALRRALQKLLDYHLDKDTVDSPETVAARVALALPPAPEPDADADMVEIVPEGAKPIFHLPDRYRSALIGHTVDARRRPRFVYSLCKLVLESQVENHCSERDAQDRVFKMMLNASAQWLDQCPVFCDDTVSQKSRIIQPGRF